MKNSATAPLWDLEEVRMGASVCLSEGVDATGQEKGQQERTYL